MKFKKYIIVLLTLFVGFGFVSSVEALEDTKNIVIDSELKMVENEKKVASILISDSINFLAKDDIINGNDSTYGGISSSNTSSSGGSGSWCTKFNNVWYVFGIAIQVIYVVTPLLLIVSGSITMIQAMMKHDPGAVTKAQKSLVNKIIAAVVVFLMISIVKMVTAFVADDGWVSCANCAFNPNQSNCEFDKVQTGQ